MTRDDIRKLLGGYATGSLSEAERKILFEAALDDQELFDELAQEQALKELLEEPGVKQRLIAGLAPPRKAGWARPWGWIAAAAATVALGFVLWRPPAKQEIAEVQLPPPRLVAPSPANTPAQPPVGAPIARQSQAARRQEPAPELPTELRKKVELPPAFQDSVSDKLESAKAPEAVGAAAPAAPVAPVPPGAAPAAPSATPPAAPSEALTIGGALAFRAPAAQQAQQGQQGQQGQQAGAVGGFGGRGGRGGGGRGGPAAAPILAVQSTAKDAGANAIARFAFDYSVTPDGRLLILPASDGFLTVGVSNGSTSQVLFSGRPAQAASTVEVPLPGDSTIATIVFTAQNAGAGVAAVSGGSVDPPSGTKTDPAPSPNSRLQAYIPLTPRE